MRKKYFHLALLIAILGLATVPGRGQSKTADAGQGARDVPAQVELTGPAVVTAMQLIGRKPVVEVTINGQGPFQFFLDTGAGATVINQDLADELKLPVVGTTKIGDPADPQGISAKQNLIGKLQVGGATFSGFIAVSWDRSILYQPGAPRGVLGMPLFRELMLTIDYPQSRIEIARGALPKANGAEVFDFQKREGGVFGVPLTVAGQELQATLDTGSPSELSFPSDYQEKLPLEAKPVEVGRGRTVGGEAVIYGATLKGAVKLAGQIFDNPRITFFGRLRNVNIGYGFIKNFAITIDQANKRMKWVHTEPAAEPATAPASDPARVAPAPAGGGEFASYAGSYGERRVTAESGKLFLQRMSGPQGAGPKLELTKIRPDEFALPGSTEVRFKFVRDTTGDVAELKVLNPQGVWESGARKPL